MTVSDFSNSFDVLLNSHAIAAGFGSTDNPGTIELDEYEKSVILTKAQEEYVLGLYTGRNSFGDGFEQTEELRRYLADLIEEKEIVPISTTSGKFLGVDSKSKFFTLPNDLWFITYESVYVSYKEDEGKKAACGKTGSLDVIPIRQDEYHKLKKNPFRGANNRRALRMDLSEGNVEIISKWPVTKYYVRYLKKLHPIVLEDLPDGLTVDGETKKSECLLHEALHQKILELAVMMALQSRGYNRNNNENR